MMASKSCCLDTTLELWIPKCWSRRCRTITTGMCKRSSVLGADHTTLSVIRPSLNRRSSALSPQKERNSRRSALSSSLAAGPWSTSRYACCGSRMSPIASHEGPASTRGWMLPLVTITDDNHGRNTAIAVTRSPSPRRMQEHIDLTKAVEGDPASKTSSGASAAFNDVASTLVVL
jgi:hypothetical protein